MAEAASSGPASPAGADADSALNNAMSSTRTAQLASLAEQADLRWGAGSEEYRVGYAAMLKLPWIVLLVVLGHGTALHRNINTSVETCRGLEKALDQIEAERNAQAGADAAAIAKAAGVPVKSLTRRPHTPASPLTGSTSACCSLLGKHACMMHMGLVCAGGGIAAGRAAHNDARAQGGGMEAAVAARARRPHRPLCHLQGSAS